MKKKLTLDDYVDWWLGRYYNTSCKKILEDRPEWREGNHFREFHNTYPVTQAQHDEWYDWYLTTGKQSIYLYWTVAPIVKDLNS